MSAERLVLGLLSGEKGTENISGAGSALAQGKMHWRQVHMASLVSRSGY